MLRIPILSKQLRLRKVRKIIHPRLCSSQPSLNPHLNTGECKSTLHHGSNKFVEGQVVHGFMVDKVSTVDEMFLTTIRLTHQKTGAEYLHLQRDDSNNVFSIGLRTTPMDSTGLPHILEHTTTCGSEKFPCKDPFMKMLRRSLATFINALTGPDYTLYPFSTQNLKDFKNLQSVYMDLVLRPKLREVDFKQEGWRLEHADVNDKNSPIIFKGVVFNEMKGVFNENQYIFMEQLLNSILPSHTYSVISGGDPLVIPNLTHKNLVEFHTKYYHPSNARFYSYGNFPLEDHLKFVNEEYLSHSDRIDVSSTRVPPEKRWSLPRKKHISCRPDPLVADPERQNTIAIAHLCNSIIDIDTTFDLYVLSQLLLKGPNSAFYKSLVDSNVGTGFATVTGYDAQCRDTMFVVGLQGVKVEDFEKVEKIYDDTVAKVVENGFRKDHVEAVLHGIELNNKHQSSNFGLHLLFNMVPLWNHDGDIINSLRINEAISKFRYQLQNDPKYLQNLVEKYLMKNTHRLTLTMSPDENYECVLAAQEKQLLEKKLAELSQEELNNIYKEGQILLAEQQKIEDVGSLPTLKIEDLKEDTDRYELQQLKVSEVPVQMSIQPTNGVCYYHSILSTRDLSNEQKTLLPLFNDVLTKMGTKNYDYRQFDEMMQLKTGGFYISNHIAEQKNSIFNYEQGIYLNSYCLDHNVHDMWKLWEELLNQVELTDLQRFETLIKVGAADLLNGIAQSGHVYAMSSASSLVSPVAKLKESFSGLEFVARMKTIAQMKDLTLVLEQIREIAGLILNKRYMRSALNISENQEESILKSMESYHEALKDTPIDVNNVTEFKPLEARQCAVHHVLPYTVNYISKTILTVPYLDPDHSALLVLSKLISSVYLHPEIREKGGAYGGGARITSNGVFAFYSYRDSNSTKTLDTFDKTYDFLSSYNFPERDITEAKLAVFQQIDAPVSPDSRGLNQFLYGLTYDEIQRERQRIKAVDKDQLMRVADKYLKLNAKDITIGRSLIGPKNSDLKNRHSENWTVLNQQEEDATQVC